MPPIPTKEALRVALAQRHGEALQAKLEQTTVAVCGLGGLGSNIAISLARAGIGTLILIDFDRVDLSNLHRQQYRANQVGRFKTEALAEILTDISPYLKIECHTEPVTQENFLSLLRGADFICEAFDDPEAKAMLTNGVLEQLPDAYLIAASGMAGLGSANAIQTKKITGHFYLCGDFVSDVADHSTLVSSRVMVCAAHQAHMVIRILAQEFEP